MTLWNQISARQKFKAQEDTTSEENSEITAGDLLIANQVDEWTPATLTGYGPETRTLLVAGEIDEALSCAICSQLLSLDAESSTTPIRVVINSPGGDIVYALAIYDVMRSIRAPVITLVQGAAYSGAFMLIQGGDIRLSFPHSRFFYHEPIQEAPVNNRRESEAVFKGYEWALESMNNIIRERADIPKKKWKEVFEGHTALFLTADEALGLGLIDELMEYQDKPAFSLEDLRNIIKEQ